jgi:hypothetical protein
MSNFFKSVAEDAEKVEEELLGPDYKYYQHIKTPEELGMSDKGSISALAKDINGIINYVELLVTGRGDANKSKGGRPLGDRFFLKTGGQCKDQASGNLVDRYMYIDNVPDGSIPFVSSGIGYKFTTFEGLIPGILSDIDKINPMDMFKAFSQDSEPACREITLETIGKDGEVSKETRFLPLDEIAVIESGQKKTKIVVKPTYQEGANNEKPLTKAELKKQREEEAKKKKEEAAEKKKEAREAALKKKQEAEEAAKKKKEEAAAVAKQKKEEAQKKKEEAATARKKRREGFANEEEQYTFVKDTPDLLTSENIYLTSVGMLYLYIFYRLIAKTTAM